MKVIFLTQQQAVGNYKVVLLPWGSVPPRMGDEKQMKAAVTNGAPPGEHSTWAEGPASLGRSLYPQHQLQFGQIHEKCSLVWGNMLSAGQRVLTWELAAQMPWYPWLQISHQSIWVTTIPFWNHLWPQKGFVPATGWETLSEKWIKTRGCHQPVKGSLLLLLPHFS